MNTPAEGVDVATDTVTTERREPTPERYSTGKPRVRMAKEDDSLAPQKEKQTGCYVCGTIQRGDGFVSLPDETGVARAVHLPTRAADGKSTDRNVACEETFKSRVTAARKQEVQQERENLALAALRREGNVPRLEQSSQRG